MISVHDEYGLPKVGTLDVVRSLQKYVPPHARKEVQSEPQLRRSERVKYPAERLTYNV